MIDGNKYYLDKLDAELGYEIGTEPGDECLRLHPPDEDGPGWQCIGTMIEDEDGIYCDECGEEA